jgi:hypothetical protein
MEALEHRAVAVSLMEEAEVQILQEDQPGVVEQEAVVVHLAVVLVTQLRKTSQGYLAQLALVVVEVELVAGQEESTDKVDMGAHLMVMLAEAPTVKQVLMPVQHLQVTVLMVEVETVQEVGAVEAEAPGSLLVITT